MNPSDDATLQRFVRALHRRQGLLRLIEYAGVGLLGGCAVALVLVPVHLWRGQDAWPVACAVLGTGTLAGAGWGFARRPTALAAATEADRQLNTADLLGTAWAMHGGIDELGGNAWRQAVLVLADARCDELSPSAVLLRRFGGRAWGGIALAVALVATLASFSSGRNPTEPARQRDAAARPEARRDAARPILQIAMESPGSQRRAEQNPGDERDRGNSALEAEPPDGTDANPTSADRTPAGSRESAAAAGGAGDGTGRIQPDATDPQNRERAPTAADPAGRQADGSRVGGGAGRAAREASEAGMESSGGSLARDGTAPAAPPWQHASWDAAVEAAGDAIRAGRVADDYHDLVRGFFDRPAAATPPSAR